MDPRLQFMMQMAQRAQNTPLGQRVTDYAQRGMEAAGRLENKWPSLPRAAGGRFPSREAIDKVPLQPFARGAAGVGGAGAVVMGGGRFEGVRDRLAPEPVSTVPQAMWDQLTAMGGGTPRSPVQQPQPQEQAQPAGMSVMDSIMAARQPQQAGAFGLQGFNMPSVQYGSPSVMFSGPGGGEVYSDDPARSVMSQANRVSAPNIPMPPSRPKDLPGRTPGFLDQLLSGPNYQSNNMPVNVQAAGPAMQGQQMPNVAINWGDSQNPADFFRADQMLQQNQQLPGFLGGF